MKDKLITISLFIVAAFIVAGALWATFSGVFERAQDGIIAKLKQVENY